MQSIWSAHVLWFMAAVALLLAELALPGFVLLFFALGAFAAAVCAAATELGAAAQVAVFLGASLAGLILLRRTFINVFRGPSRGPDAAGLDNSGVGQSAVVTKAIAPGVPGEIKHRGSFWRAESEHELPEGAIVVILGQARHDPATSVVGPVEEKR